MAQPLPRRLGTLPALQHSYGIEQIHDIAEQAAADLFLGGPYFGGNEAFGSVAT